MKRRRYNVRLLKVAEDDFTGIITYVAADRLLAADALASKIEKSLQLLSHNPRIGRVPKEEELVQLGYRYLVVDNYLIFYTIEAGTVYVHRIIHGARDYVNLF